MQKDINCFSNILQKCEHQIMFISEYNENKQDCKYGNDYFIIFIESNITINNPEYRAEKFNVFNFQIYKIQHIIKL